MKRSTLLCRCGRGVFSLSELMVVHDDPTAYSPGDFKVATCLSCGVAFVADLRSGKQGLTHVLDRRAMDKVLADVRENYLEGFKGAPTLLVDGSEQERAR